MHSTATYLAAALPRKFTILGQALLPFSLWHMEVLLRLDNAFVSERNVNEGDLIQGIFLCCQTWEEGEAALRDWTATEKKLAAWGKAVGPDLFRVRKGQVESLLPEKAQEFIEYLQEGCKAPFLMPMDDVDSRAPGAPLIQLLKLFLMRELRLSMSQAMNYGYSLACHDYFAWHEERGAAQIANAEEAAKLAEHERDAESDATLKACLAALPGAVPVTAQDREKVRAWRKRKGKKCLSS